MYYIYNCIAYSKDRTSVSGMAWHAIYILLGNSFRAHYRHQYRDLILLVQIAIAIHSVNL